MKEQSDTLVKLIHDAAGQVGPLDGIDGEAMARRAIRHERTRRGVIGGAVAIVLVTLGTVGTAWITERPLLPAVLPWMHDEVRSDGLVFEVPDDYEEFSPTGDPMWGLDPVIPGELDMDSLPSAESWVAVDPVDGVPLVGRQVGNPVVDTEVPGAVAAKYSWYTADGAGEPMADELTADAGDFVGELDVELVDGTVVRVTMKLHDDATPQATFERLVGTVRIDEEYEGPETLPMIPQEDLPLLKTGEVPASWREAEFHGLEYAVPGDWGTGLSAENVGETQILKRPDGKVELRMELTDHLMYLDNAQMAAEYAELGDELGDYYRFDLAGSDVAQVRIERFDGEYQAYIEVRRAGGRGYIVNFFGRPGAGDLDDDLAALLGSLGLTAASKDGAIAYDDLDPADPLLQDPPSDWEPVTFEGLEMSLPQELKSDEGSWGIWNSDSPDSWEDLSISLWDLEAYEQPFDLDESGYRYEPPGTARGVVTVGTDPETGESFLGHATFWLTADGRKSFEVRYEGSGATEERWWQILASLDAGDLDVS
ncbi:hypothetical protein [Promicromonospora soli]|uniref:Uncharacterized protein n=1 Tax=Promicromonospora soli TaxID=2035533 RepID=A0A919KV11_9MICO|nr:hypothetical protein [Promicromonospora soli]GHH73527.1 hypothetical protein GCM10017772_25370 [Promicromonospora soli]